MLPLLPPFSIFQNRGLTCFTYEDSTVILQFGAQLLYRATRLTHLTHCTPYLSSAHCQLVTHQALCYKGVQRDGVALWATSMQWTEISNLGLRPIFPRLRTPLLSNALSQNWPCVTFYGPDSNWLRNYGKPRVLPGFPILASLWCWSKIESCFSIFFQPWSWWWICVRILPSQHRGHKWSQCIYETFRSNG